MAANPTGQVAHIHYTFVETSVDRMSSEQHSYGHLLQVDLPRGTWYAHSLAVAYADFRPQHVRWKLPFRLASWMQSIGSKFDLGFVLDLLHLDDHEFSRQVVTRLSRSQDRTLATLSSAQVKDLVWDNMVITLGARQTLNIRGSTQPKPRQGGRPPTSRRLLKILHGAPTGEPAGVWPLSLPGLCGHRPGTLSPILARRQQCQT